MVAKPLPRRQPLVAVLTDVADEAIGHGHRHDPVAERSGGPAGNARLTAWLGLLALVVTLAELVTLLDIGGLVSWHVALGVVLSALALAKTGSTGWRIVRYYLGARTYVQAGPPPLLLRLLGPLVIVSTLGVLCTGFVLIAEGRQQSDRALFTFAAQGISPMLLHKAFFVLFAASAGLHVLARLVPAAVLASGRPRRGTARTVVPGRAARFGIVTGGIVASLVAVVIVLPVNGWDHQQLHRGGPHHSRH